MLVQAKIVQESKALVELYTTSSLSVTAQSTQIPNDNSEKKKREIGKITNELKEMQVVQSTNN